MEQRPCIRRYRPLGKPATRCVFFPWAGGGASVARRFLMDLPPTVDAVAIQLPGREDRISERPMTQMADVIAHVAGSLLALEPIPTVFVGHSMGALVAYEVARALSVQHQWEPDLLIVSGSSGGRRVSTRCRSDASDEDFIADLRRMGGTPARVLEDTALMRTFLLPLRADYAILEGYQHRPQPLLRCRLIACAGDADPMVSPNAMIDWCSRTTGPTEVHWLSGDHFYLCSTPAAFSDRLQDWIASI